MGKPIARVGDPVFNAADFHPWHGAVCVTGNIVFGSVDTFTNDRPTAIANPLLLHPHALCTDLNVFKIQTGSDRVFTNDFPTGRSGDLTDHCGSAPPFGTPGIIEPRCSTNTYA